MSYNHNIWDQALSYDSPKVKSGAGKNRIPPPKEKPLWKAYLEKFEDPLIIILCVILVLSCGVTAYEIVQSGDLKLLFEPAGILMAILLSTGIGFWFEVKAGNEFKILNTVKDDRQVKVIRKIVSGSRAEMMSIKKCDVVPGDIVKLDSGDEVPADGYILDCDNLVVDESAYTGEPLANKGMKGQGPDDCAYAYDFLLRGSIVVEGSCYYKVSAVGVDTEEGKGAIKLQEEDDIETPLNSQLGQLGNWLTKGSYIIAALIIVGRLIYYFAVYHGGDYDTLHMIEFILTSIMIAVTLIVVAVPEGLPMSVNVSLALSMKKMLREKNLVRKMHACETMGATTVICTDKTGTLTQNKMTVLEHDFKCEDKLVSTAIAVNSTAELSKKEDGSFMGIGNPTEAALLQWILSNGINYTDVRDAFKVTEREPFSTETKFMSTTVESGGHKYRFYKGAPEIILDKCQVMPNGITKQDVLDTLTSYQKRAMRTLGFAYQDLSEDASSPITYMGIVGIADPVREGVKEAIETCTQRAGVRVIMVTGDVALTAAEIGRQIGLVDIDSTNEAITGNEFMKLSDEEAMKILPNLRILSRAHPEDKARLVELLQRMGEVVAVTGDGTNDALALKKAQVGLSMGDGTARAKEVSDITIIDNSFASINKAILWGRSLYMNIRRFIVFQMTINFCACLVVLAGAFTGLDSPLTVTQMLWVNLIMDTFAAMALSSLPADPKVMDAKPRNPKSHIVDRGMLKRILLSGGAFFILMVGLWQLLWHTNITEVSDMLNWDAVKTFFKGLFSMEKKSAHLSQYELGVFFSTFVLLQFWNLFNTRYFRTGRSLIVDLVDIIRGKRKASESFSSGFLLIAVVILLGQILIVNVAGEFFDAAPLSLKDWTILLGISMPVWIIYDVFRSVRFLVRKK